MNCNTYYSEQLSCGSPSRTVLANIGQSFTQLYFIRWMRWWNRNITPRLRAFLGKIVQYFIFHSIFKLV